MSPFILLPLLLLGLRGRGSASSAPAGATPDWAVYDITAKSDKSRRQGKSAKRRIMIHQTDGNGSDNPNGWTWVKSHWGILNNRGIVLIHPLDVDIQGSYANTIAIEVGGRFPAFLNPDPSDKEAIKFNKGHTKRVNAAQARGIEAAIRNSVAFILRSDPTVRTSDIELVAHRQIKASRIFDPGQEVYQIAARVAKQLGMKVPYDYEKDSGHPVPPAWRVGGIDEDERIAHYEKNKEALLASLPRRESLSERELSAMTAALDRFAEGIHDGDASNDAGHAAAKVYRKRKGRDARVKTALLRLSMIDEAIASQGAS